MLDPEIIERDWTIIAEVKDAPIAPVFTVQGLYAWTVE
jgi:hypothetical protein